MTSVKNETLNVSSRGPVYRSIYDYADRTAVIDDNGRYTYRGLHSSSINLRDRLLRIIPSGTLYGERVAFLCNQDVTYIITQWSCWLGRGICVPLCRDHPAKLLEYYIEDSRAAILVSTKNFENVLLPIADKFNIPLVIVIPEDLKMNMDENEAMEKDADIFSDSADDALIIYTSGTTGPPKGVVHTIKTLKAQMDAMIKAWKWSVEDCILNTLPLHHVHGIVNCVMTSVYNGSTLVMEHKFDAHRTWNHLLNDNNPPISIFMAVPTVYIKLIEVYKEMNWDSNEISNVKNRCTEHIRLFVSGSAALPEFIFEQWKQLTGFEILEQYGMSEVGRILSNTTTGKKLPGTVGLPMPGIILRVVRKNDDNSEIIMVEGTIGNLKIPEKSDHEEENVSGELFVKGPTLFKHYFNKEDETKKSFTEDNFFATGKYEKPKNFRKE